MERRLIFGLAIAMLVLAGCGSSNSNDSAPSAAPAPTTVSADLLPTIDSPDMQVVTDPAAVAAHQFLDAVVKGDTATASSLLTPLAIERINQSGKPFQLPGLANYTFQIVAVRKPVPDKAFVQCYGTDRSAGEQAANEEFCWLMCLVDDQWRIAGISYTMGPQNQLMIYSFENPEKGAIPVDKLMPQQPAAGQTAAAPGTQPATQMPVYQPPVESQPDRYSTKPAGTAPEALPVGAYR